MEADPREFRERVEPVNEPSPRRQAYASPRLISHGPVPAVTAADETSGPVTDESDRALKTGFAPVDPQAILARVVQLPLTTWSYRTDPATVRHLGPMAQDFAAAFEVGTDDRHIHSVDASGVALAAIQGLAQLIEAQRAELTALRAAVEGLAAENRALWIEHRDRTEARRV